MFKRMKDSFTGTPQAPRMGKIPLPDVRGEDLPTPHGSEMLKVPVPRGPRRQPLSSLQNDGYSTSPEASSSRPSAQPASRCRRPSDARVAPPPKGILKRPEETPARTAARLQELDGYASSPEKLVPSKTHRNHAPHRSETTAVDSARAPNPLHWKLLPYNDMRSKYHLVFDVRFNVDLISLVNSRYQRRPLEAADRVKLASNSPIRKMIIRCADLEDWPIYVESSTAITCIDVFNAIHEQLSTPLTRYERHGKSERVAQCHTSFEERCRQVSMNERAKGYRRFDLLAEKSFFNGLDWVPPSKEDPDGHWALKLATAKELFV